MPTITIDNQTYEFEPGTMLLQFCLDNGIELPHFCYHPAMSVPANCRQCLVRVGMPAINRETKEPELDEEGNPVINWARKLATSCSQDMSDGMVVQTHMTSEEVDQAQEANLEFLLINHPLDCPICDQAGQCPLQIQAYKYGPEGSRFEFEKVHKPKRVDLGPRVKLDAERCINCTRCTRFTDEVSGSHQLTIIHRSVKNYPMTPPGVIFDEPYSMNVIDICPVGALTSKDSRFKERAWNLSNTPSISVHSSMGVNVEYRVRDNRIIELKPRTNLHVNEYWIADADRLDYHRFNDNRPSGPRISDAPASWEQALERAASLISEPSEDGIVFFGSAHATVEDNYLLLKLAKSLGAAPPQYIPHVEPGSGDGWLITDDKAPNAQGCERLGLMPVDELLLRERLANGEVKVLYILEEDPLAAGLLSPEDLNGVAVILHYHNTTNQTLPFADVALPAATAVETIGTMVNVQGRAQWLRPVKEIKSINRSLMMEMGKSRLDRHGTPFDRWYNEENKVDCRPSWDLLQALADVLGKAMRYKGPKAIMEEIAAQIPAFEGATYKAMGLQGVQLTEIGEPV